MKPIRTSSWHAATLAPYLPGEMRDRVVFSAEPVVRWADWDWIGNERKQPDVGRTRRGTIALQHMQSGKVGLHSVMFQ